ncbi:MAG: molybdopterin-dependent oxidoreductase [Clostridia bacterium]|nr:molybdopterin-dependent oxidoreductase [Clostridia bacterium]
MSVAKAPSKAGSSKDTQWTQSVCKMCLAGCGIKVKTEEGVVTKIEGDPSNPDNYEKLCGKGNAGLMRLYDPHRVKAPMIRTNPDKGPGVDPKWKEISWDEAMDIVGKKLKAIREDDPRKLVCAVSDFQRIHLWAWPAAFGSPHYFTTVGQYCGAAYHPINGILDGSFACINDYDYCDYWIQIGCGDGFSSHLHLSGSATRMADARVKRGMKVVYVEPRMSAGAAKADEWIPILPGTDRAFVMGMIYVMVYELKKYDAEFLKTKTNAPYLIGPDGHYVRDKNTGKPLVWDEGANKARTFDDMYGDSKQFALEGKYKVEGVECRPGFEIFKEILKDNTPDKMSKVCTVPSDTIRRIAKEYVEAAKIGSTIMLDGKEYPYRPAAVNYYRGALAHIDGAIDNIAYKMLNILIGNIDVPGGHLGVPMDHRGLWVEPGPDGMIKPQPHMLHPPYPLKNPPDSYQLMEWFPLGVDAGHMSLESILEPAKFGHSYEPEAMLIYHSNPMWNMPATSLVQEVFKKMKFIIAIDVIVNESTEWADIILPDHSYLESTLMVCLEPPVVTGHALRQPAVNPLYNSRDAGDILTDIAERVGCLGNWNDILNFVLGLINRPELMLEPDKKYNHLEIMDRVAKCVYGDDKGLDWFRKHGHAVRIRTPEEVYLPYGENRIPFYFGIMLEEAEKVKKLMAETKIEWDVSAYQPLPIWRETALFTDNLDYDLFAICFKSAIVNFSESTSIPWIGEIVDKTPDNSGVWINPVTAQAKGIKDGDEIIIESAADKILGIARLTHEVHPDVLAISNAISRFAEHSGVQRRMGTHFNKLLPTGLKWTDMCTGALETTVRVKVRKA